MKIPFKLVIKTQFITEEHSCFGLTFFYEVKELRLLQGRNIMVEEQVGRPGYKERKFYRPSLKKMYVECAGF